MAFCVLLEDGALTSHVADPWWMTWHSQFTFGWWSELNCQNAWVSDGQCLACSDLFLMKWVDPAAFAPARFDKLNKAGLLQRLTSVFPLGQQNSVSWISGFYYQLHLYSASLPTSGSSLTFTHLLQVWFCPRLGHQEHTACAHVVSTQLHKVTCWGLVAFVVRHFASAKCFRIHQCSGSSSRGKGSQKLTCSTPIFHGPAPLYEKVQHSQAGARRGFTASLLLQTRVEKGLLKTLEWFKHLGSQQKLWRKLGPAQYTDSLSTTRISHGRS